MVISNLIYGYLLPDIWLFLICKITGAYFLRVFHKRLSYIDQLNCIFFCILFTKLGKHFDVWRQIKYVPNRVLLEKFFKLLKVYAFNNYMKWEW